MTTRFLLGASALLLAFGGITHATAFPRAEEAAGALAPFFAGSFKLLWLADSAMLLLLSLTFATIALKPEQASRFVIAVLACMPLATAALLYTFLGAFFAGHLLAAAGALAMFAALLNSPKESYA